MKKNIFALIAMTGLVMTSCNTDSNDTTSTVEYPTCNLVTSLSTGVSSASTGSYRFLFNITQAKVSFATDNFKIDGNSHTLASDTVSYVSYMVQTDHGTGSLQDIRNFKGYMDRDRNMKITDSHMMISSVFNYNLAPVPGLTTIKNHPMIVGQYKIGNEWEVRTFSDDAFYSGKTVTNYKDRDGSDKTFESTGMMYRIVIDMAKNKATMVIYNAKFSDSEHEPVKSMILVKDLYVKWGAGYYTVTGKDIVPEMPENNVLTPNPKYIFNDITFRTTSDDLVSASIDYNVAGIYKGSFSGAYVYVIYDKDKE